VRDAGSLPNVRIDQLRFTRTDHFSEQSSPLNIFELLTEYCDQFRLHEVVDIFDVQAHDRLPFIKSRKTLPDLIPMVLFHHHDGIGPLQVPFFQYHICSLVGACGINLEPRVVLVDLVGGCATHPVYGADEEEARELN